jgi:hypothetical protein
MAARSDAKKRGKGGQQNYQTQNVMTLIFSRKTYPLLSISGE